MRETDPEYIAIGKITAPWGVDGRVKVSVETDFPERFSHAARVYVDRREMTVDSVSWHKGRAIVKFEGLDSDTEADDLTGKLVEVHRSQLFDLREDEYYHFQLIGMKVRTTGGEVIGEVTDILAMSSADVYVVKSENGEILIPAIDDVVKSVDVESGVLTIEPVEGLLNLNKRKAKQKKL